jgi:hypothetical protein
MHSGSAGYTRLEADTGTPKPPMSRFEAVNVSGLRVDGRRAREVRRLRCTLGVLPRADGSAVFEQGNTRVLCVVTGPGEARRPLGPGATGSASVVCEYLVSAFASPERRIRRPGDRRTAESASTLQQLFEGVIQRQLYPQSEICIFVHVLQSDGGALCGEPLVHTQGLWNSCSARCVSSPCCSCNQRGYSCTPGCWYSVERYPSCICCVLRSKNSIARSVLYSTVCMPERKRHLAAPGRTALPPPPISSGAPLLHRPKPRRASRGRL